MKDADSFSLTAVYRKERLLIMTVAINVFDQNNYLTGNLGELSENFLKILRTNISK